MVGLGGKVPFAPQCDRSGSAFQHRADRRPSLKPTNRATGVQPGHRSPAGPPEPRQCPRPEPSTSAVRAAPTPTASPSPSRSPTDYRRLTGACSHRGNHRSLQVTTSSLVRTSTASPSPSPTLRTTHSPRCASPFTTCATSIGTCVTRASRPPPIRGLQGGYGGFGGQSPLCPPMRQVWKRLPASGRQAPKPEANQPGPPESNRATGVQPGHRSPAGTPEPRRARRQYPRPEPSTRAPCGPRLPFV
jgi:hypothetical protein